MTRRNSLAVILMVFLLITVIIGCAPIVQDDFLLHEDKDYKVKILYPKEWELVVTDTDIFAFRAPKLNQDIDFQASLNLQMNDVSGQELTLDKFKELALENLEQTVQDFAMIESNSVELAGLPAIKLVFTGYAPYLKFMQVMTLKDDLAYILTFTSDKDSFESYISTVQKMLDSFEITSDLSGTKEENSRESNLAGIYRCWSYNVAGAGKSCTSPPITLNEDGTYSMSSEKGTYTVDDDTIILSESKIRGPGKILEDGMQIMFEYDYNGWHHTITYLKADWENAVKQENGEESVNYVEVSLNIKFPEGTGASWINSAALVEKGKDEIVGETLAYESAPSTVRALFRQLATKPGIPTGKIYTVKVSSGFGYWAVGEIDLRNVKEDIEIDIDAKSDTSSTSANDNSPSNSNTNDGQQTSQPASEQQTTTPPSNEQTQPTDIQPAADGPKCDPNIPKYSQPGCVE